MSQAETPALSEVRKNLWIDWYRCPIDRTKLRELSQPSDRRGAFQGLGHLAIWVCTGLASYYLFKQELWVGLCLALFLHGTVGCFFTAPHHELCHGTVFKTKWLNSLFLRIFALLGWHNFYVYKFSHSYHHRFTLHPEGDREVVLPKTPTLRALYILQLFTVNVTGGFESRGLAPTITNTVKLAFNRFDRPFNEWGSELYEGHPGEQEKAANWARLLLLFHFIVIAGSIAIGEPILAVLLSGHAFIASWHRYFVGATMHCGLRSNVADFRKCVRTIRLDPLSEFLYWYMNWHLEHHMYAAVPCYNLKKLYDVVAHEMPRPRTLVGAWREMRETLKKQQADPSYEYDTPVPAPRYRESSGANDALAASMGNLAPEAIA